MGTAALTAHPEVAEIRFSAPNKHHFLVDLTPFGLDNPGEVFYAADRPYGLIEAAVTARRRARARPGLVHGPWLYLTVSPRAGRERGGGLRLGA